MDIVGRRLDGVSGVIVRSEHFIDGGTVFQVNAANCGNSASVFAVGSGAFTPSCSGNPDVMASSITYTGAMVHYGYAGSFALYDTSQLTIGGSLGQFRAVLPDGGEPNPADYPSGWVMCENDHCWFPYAGLHGNVTSIAVVPMYAGNLAEWQNRTNDDGYRSHKAGINWLGGYWQNHGLTREQFPLPLCETTMTSLGQYRFMMPSTLMYAEDTKHWYYTDCSQWIQLATTNEVDAINAQMAALEQRVTALESCHGN
jgi:hypothetical protein